LRSVGRQAFAFIASAYQRLRAPNPRIGYELLPGAGFADASQLTLFRLQPAQAGSKAGSFFESAPRMISDTYDVRSILLRHWMKPEGGFDSDAAIAIK
jgi:hypothetical protein